MYTQTDMSKITSMKTGGMAKCCFPESIEELVSIINKLLAANEKFHILGNMSNVLLPDENVGFVCVVTTKINTYKVMKNKDDSISVIADCGIMLTKLALEMCKKGYSGLEFAYGIPGTVGGAVFMNAGAYGSEIANIAEYVEVFELKTGNVLKITKENCRFGYRESIFQSGEYIILSACFKLTKSDAEKITGVAKQTMQKRIEKQPLEYPSCGSAFKRPQGYFAGDLIERSGLKGFTVGGACVSEKHAGFIINKGNATTNDVVSLIQHVRKTVKEKFGVELEPEIRVIE